MDGGRACEPQDQEYWGLASLTPATRTSDSTIGEGECALIWCVETHPTELPFYLPVVDRCEAFEVRLKRDSESRFLQRGAADLPVANVEEQPAMTFDVKVGMVLLGELAFGVGQVLKAEAVVVAVSFAVVDAENSECCEVLMQRHERHVRKVFSRLECRTAMSNFKVTSQAEVEQRFEEALTVLVRGSGVADLEGVVKRIQCSVGLVDDELFFLRKKRPPLQLRP